MTRSANQIRQEFIDFFKGKRHTFVRSAPVIPQDDPSLLFTNAGMNQFKAIFLGENRDGLSRAVNSQKCMRVSGKHNDLEEVGRDHSHHTFFEMLGNWSFGDYHKKDAVRWAWELLTGVWGLDKDRLFATVHHTDDEAAKLWVSETGIPTERVLRFGDEDNFWEMGETGPCGPCSEIHYDTGDAADREQVFRDPAKGVNGQDGRFLEVWNLVFIQHNRRKDGSLEDLPKKHVDTGMGFERVVRLIQGAESNYATDLFLPVIARLEKLSGRRYGHGAEGVPFRVIADHIRALVFAITDGAFPSNEGRGYVLRRLLRRAYRFGRELGFRGPFLHAIVPAVVDMMGDAFPELRERREHVVQLVRSEEERFGQTLEQGIEIFSQMMERSTAEGDTELSGADVFTLYDTYGFPMDLTRLMAREKGFTVDERGFDELMEQQRDRGREATRRGDDAGLTAEGWVELQKIDGTTFVGYREDEAEARVARYKALRPEGSTDACVECLLVLDQSPFYAESGGQVGDSGTLTARSGRELPVVDTFKWNDMHVHKVVSPTSFPLAELAEPLLARVNTAARNQTRRNHSATHLLQAALRQVLGDHVQQSGSKVEPERLRFDFTHFKALTPEEIAKVEALVNEWILADFPVATEVRDTETARREGAMALFGEKYADKARVVGMGRVSKELCGGTHVVSTGRIGLFHILTETSISAGIRRIEAITGMNSVAYLARKEDIVSGLTATLKTAEDGITGRVAALMDRVKALETEVARLSQDRAGQQVASIIEEAGRSGDMFPWTVKHLGRVDKKGFATVTDAVSDMIRQRNLATTVVVLGAVSDGGIMLSACAGPKSASAHGIHCGEIVKAAAQKAGGNGGGSPTRAQAGGKDPDRLDDALATARGLIKQKAGAS
ncbi:MAG: alanine--tRNA ligase [Chitinivibrionales bacterium]|nr:alanine--tRNA ligase [Chitinivibrionales bacterium]MBD3394661.1 alanine--tRNA ligase [Chitinivibrionales bacterium]